MGFMDKLKGLFGGNKQQIDQGIDKTAEAVKDKVPDQHDDKVDAVADKAHEVVDNLTDTTPPIPRPAESGAGRARRAAPTARRPFRAGALTVRRSAELRDEEPVEDELGAAVERQRGVVVVERQQIRLADGARRQPARVDALGHEVVDDSFGARPRRARSWSPRRPAGRCGR